jgi:hypothetical protein
MAASVRADLSLTAGVVRVSGMADVHAEIDRLERDGVRFSIATRGDGFIARVGDYLNGPTPSRQVATVEEAVRWVSTVTRSAESKLEPWGSRC